MLDIGSCFFELKFVRTGRNAGEDGCVRICFAVMDGKSRRAAETFGQESDGAQSRQKLPAVKQGHTSYYTVPSKSEAVRGAIRIRLGLLRLPAVAVRREISVRTGSAVRFLA